METRWIWPFELLEKIGEGGMGVVYRARCVTNNKIVAVKLLPSEISSDRVLVARFEREMNVLKTLDHPHIVHCFGGVCKGSQRYYAMELVDGGSLQQLIKKHKRLRWKRAVGYAVQICAGLGYAHENGIVHRDVKPANFLLTDRGQLKISDFGIAYVTTATKITAAGKTVGSYHYMAPEQIRGEGTIGPQTDLYALGCVFFEMLTGQPPFDGDTPATILHQHVHNPPPRISEAGIDCPDPTFADFVINSLLEKSVEKRPGNSQTVIDWLNASTRTTAAPAKKGGRGKSKGARSAKSSTRRVTKGLFDRIKKFSRLVSVSLTAVIVFVASSLFWNVRSPSGPVEDISSPSRAEALWIEASSSPHAALRIAASEALGQIGQTRDFVIPALIDRLADDSADVRRTAVIALGSLGPKSRSALTPLIRMQQRDPDPMVRRLASDAIPKIREQ